MNTTANSALQTADRQTPAILITGATGSIGTELTKTLSERGIRFRAMVRSPKDAQTVAQLAGADVVLGDFNDPVTIAHALRGIERAFLLTNSSDQAENQQLNFVAEAQRAGLKQIVKLSQFAAAPDSPVRFLRYHAVVEQAIRESGMDFTFLRPNLFMQGLLGFRSSIIEQGKFFAAVGDARISLVDVRDIAAVGAEVLVEPGHVGKIYTLTGPQALTHVEIADELSIALGRRITFVDVPPAAMRNALAGVGFPDWQADGLIEDYAHYSRNEASSVEPGVEAATGKMPRSFTDFARDYAPAFN
ncbi:NAD(P)H-binding protein [Spirosoma sp. HMF3257]|uniref:SDR family NAD(P)-dependent oxidoreductase n=1 Tax=Spirosoma telluris TaxID=2183553 RepID=A0A327NHQ6_9BACT|nr:NAD(P)H-binding protein [Spirosoma telluris]RAI73839.1 SDR family NAD(P)-dependent oxidoreductase [Spirosoma telluris]